MIPVFKWKDLICKDGTFAVPTNDSERNEVNKSGRGGVVTNENAKGNDVGDHRDNIHHRTAIS